MATHQVKAGMTAQYWDRPETPRTNKGQLQAGTDVTVAETRQLDVSYSRLTAPVIGWTKSGWLVALPASPPPPPPAPAPSTEYILHVKDGVTRKFIPE